ncbi:MAG: hypothetical protein E7408_01790 [Ruminococcaceae bacterium]|nr:hypothetical protein [Oscillospiraceae bacterium]
MEHFERNAYMKKILSILICTCMMITVFSVPGIAENKAQEVTAEIPMGSTDVRLPAVEGTEDLLKNGNLEEIDASGKPVGWSSRAYDGENGVGASIVTGREAYDGHSLKLVAGAAPAANPFISQSFETKPGAIYQLRTMVRKDVEGGFMTVKLEFYPEATPGLSIAWQVNTFVINTTNGKWQEALYNFKAPINAKSLSIYLRLMHENGAVCYYDDASIRMVQMPEALSISPDQYFYYPDAEKGTVDVKALTEYYPEAIGGSVAFSLLDGNNVLQQNEAVLNSNGEAVFEYDTTLLTELKKEYILRVVLKDKEGKEIYTKEDTIYKYPRPKYVREDGVYQVPGEEPFQVVGVYHPYSEKDYTELKKAGISVIQGGESQLEKAGNNGMKVLMVLYEHPKSAAHPEMREKTIEMVTKYKDDPRVFGWAVSDEPYFNLPDPLPELKEAYKLIRDIDDNHPVYIVELTDKFLKDTQKVCDYVANDPYLPATKGLTGVKMDTTHVYDTTRIAVDAANGIKPTFELLHAFHHIDYFPDADAERHMIYQAYMAGATSHGYYAWDDAMRIDGKAVRLADVTETDIYEGITSFAAKERDDVFRHFAIKEYPGFSHYVGEDVMYHGYIKDNKLYMIVMNQSTEEEKTFQIPLTSFDDSITIDRYQASYINGYDGEDFRKSSNMLEVTVPKHGVSVVEVVPTQKADFASLSKDAFWEYFKAVNENPDHSEGMNAHFTDIDEYDWAQEAIESLYKEGIVNEKEEGIFAPADKITRAEFAGFLVRTLGLTSDSTELFGDVAENHEFAKEIAIGKALGILKGTDGVNYNPEAEISRQDLMVICARGMRLVKELAEGEEPTFSDKDKIAEYAREDVAAMVKAEIVTGYTDGTIGPLGNTTRAEAAVIMDRILAWKAE